MKTKESFYTPSFDELSHGFQMEVLQDNEWKPRTFELKDWPYQQNHIRVKHLDVKDIEDLGFHFRSRSEDEYYFTKPIQSLLSNDYVTLWFKVINGRPFISLADSSNDYLLSPVFIQNKQELKWLLNRYGY